MTVGNHTLPSNLMQSCTDGMMSCLNQWAYDVTNGWFFVLALGSFIIALFLASVGIMGNKRAFGLAGATSLFGGVWLAIMQLISWPIATIFIIIGLISLVIMIMDEK